MRKISDYHSPVAVLDLATSWGRRLLDMDPRPGTSTTSRARPDGPLSSESSRALSMHFNAGALIINAVVSSALGYPFWLIAARSFESNEVGLGLGLIAAMRFCTQVALLGIGAAIVILLPRRELNRVGILNTAFTLTLGSTLVTAIGFVLLSSVLFDELNRVSSSPYYVFTFVTLCLVAVMSLLFDSTFTALRRSDRVLMRSVVQGVAALGILGICGFILNAGGVSSILLAWIGAFFASALAGYYYLRIFMPEFRFRLFASRATARIMVNVGLRNAALNVTASVPVLIIPIVITEVLSPSDNAYWYAAWMFAGLASFISNGATTALFSELTNRPDLKRRRARQTIRLCLVLGIPTALGIAVFGEFGLRLMGQDYVDAGLTPLRILLIGMLARPFIATYVTEQRSSNCYAEPTAFSAISGAVVVTGAAIGGALYGLDGAAVAWVVAQVLAAIWASWRLRHIWARSTTTDAPVEEPASVVRAVIPGQGAGKGG